MSDFVPNLPIIPKEILPSPKIEEKIEKEAIKPIEVVNKGRKKGLKENKKIEPIEEEIEPISEEVNELDVSSLFIEKKEQRYALELAKKYLKDYVIETVSDRNTLKQLIYLETLQLRLNRSLNEFEKEDKLPPPFLIDALHKNINQISDLKNQLSLTKPKTEKMESGLQYLTILKKKFAKWREENQGSRTLVCPHCGKMVMLKIRTEAWEAQKHPFFKDRLIANIHLLTLYKQNKITRDDIAKVLETSPDYIDWLLTKIKSDE